VVGIFTEVYSHVRILVERRHKWQTRDMKTPVPLG